MNIPSRPSTALSGSEFVRSISAESNKEPSIVKELLSGNVPDFFRNFVPITVNKGSNVFVYKVSPDYLCIGNDQDYIRVPLSGPSAQRIADAFGCTLPTTTMSDQIFAAAKVKVAPKPMTGSMIGKSDKEFYSKDISNFNTSEKHNQIIQEQLKNKNHVPGELVAGMKKDLVIDNGIKPGKLGLHGMHDESGKPIQSGLSNHDQSYFDYSSGIRLIDRNAILNGKPVDISKVLTDDLLAGLISKEALKNTSYNQAPKEEVAVNSTIESRKKILERINSYLDSLTIT